MKNIVLVHVVPGEAARDKAYAHLLEVSQHARIDVEPLVVVTENLREAVLKVSSSAGIVMLGFAQALDLEV